MGVFCPACGALVATFCARELFFEKIKSETIFVKPTCGKARHSCYYFAKVHVHACMHPSGFVQAITPYIYAWISKLFDTVVVLEEEKCHLKHVFR